MNKYVLQGTYINRSYQLAAQLNVQNSEFGTIKYNASIIYNWTRNKFAILDLPPKIGSISKSRSGHKVDIIYDLSHGYFCLNAEHPDQSVPGRMWTIEAEIILLKQEPRLGVHVSYSTPKNAEVEKAGFSIPKFVKDIYSKNGLIDEYPMQGKAIVVKSEAMLYELFDFIHSEKRNLPIVVITEKVDVSTPDSQYYTGYLINGDRLAYIVRLVAHVVILPHDYEMKWNELSGRNWGVFGGAVRTYYPGADFGSEDQFSHPLALPNNILASVFGDRDKEYIGGEAFEKILEGKLKDYNTSVRYDWGALGHKFFLVANRERILQEQNQIVDLKALQKTYTEQIERYETKIKEQEDDIYTAWEDKECAKKELDTARDIIRRQNSLINSLRYQLSLNGKADSDIPIYDTYNKLSEWINEYFPGRIRILGRAEQSLKNAEFEDVQLVYRSVLLLGTDYYNMRMGIIERSEFEKKCQELGIDEAESIADARAGELGDTYFVKYGGKKVKIDRHLRKGKVTRDPKRCMRIYFFWDVDESQVVLCSLPQHLEIRSS